MKINAQKIIEVVANFSEGRDLAKINKIVSSLQPFSQSIAILNAESSTDANRTVLTFAGEPERVLKASCALAESVFLNIDMRQQRGVHPRIGALDVCPFIPIYKSSIDECSKISKIFAETISKEFNLPIYLYKESAKKPERKILSKIRKGEYEGLKSKLKNPLWKPDYGKAEFNEKLGATITGAREILIAWNISLNNNDLKLAKKIASILRKEFKNLRAIGWSMEKEYGFSQVSLNVENYLESPLFDIYNRAKEIAKENSQELTGSELIGIAPKAAFIFNGQDIDYHSINLTNFSVDKLIETQIESKFNLF